MVMDCTEGLVGVGTASVPVRIYGRRVGSRDAPLVLHLHGGAFVGGTLDAGRAIARLLADAGAIVVSADYPLAPEHPFPGALNAAFGVLSSLHANRGKWASKRPSLFVAGEEAGGNLAAGLALMARDQRAPPLAGQILLSPMLDPCMGTCSLRQAEAGPVGCKWADGWHHYLGSVDKASHPYAAPLGSSRLAGLAPALVLTAEDDPLRDESLTYARRLCEAGVTVQEHVLAAPTGWPDALGLATTAPVWASPVRDHFIAFFAARVASLRSLSSVRPHRA
jgi:acetyl esterase